MSLIRRSRRRGLSLLECLLALAILGGALIVIMQTSAIGMKAGARSRTIVDAQILCESLTAELAAGSATPIPITEQEVPDAPGWVYSVAVDDVDQAGLLSVTVTVTQGGDEDRPLSFSLTRWIVDPGVEIVEQPKPPVTASESSSGQQGAASGQPTTGQPAFGQPAAGVPSGTPGTGPGGFSGGGPGGGFPGGGPGGGRPGGNGGRPGGGNGNGGGPNGGFPGGSGPPGGFGGLPGGGPPGAGS